MEDKALERFLRYVKVDTQSDDNSESTPSTLKQLDLSRLLMKELDEMGIPNEMDEYGRVYAHLKGEKGLDAIGLNAHVDTALEVTGKDVKPQVIHNYDGGIIRLNDEYSMSPAQFPRLSKYVGGDLVVTSGDTLLGGDDKSGLAIIMAVLDHYVSHPEEKHHPISILFTPDEEIGRGPEHFNREKFGAEFAYTIDGADIDIIEYENFNGAHADVVLEGISIHPGEAKGKMINAIHLASEFDSMLNPEERPEKTERYEGFNHPTVIEGGSEKVFLHYIIRNHDRAKLEAQKQEFLQVRDELRARYPKAKIEVTIKDDYRNMREVLDKDPRALEHARKVYRSLGIEPRHEPIRGGTDGATFSFLGCPTPNLGTGSYNHHGRFEYLSVDEFHKMIEIVKALVRA